jgi:excisionase family DNA binding protein
METMMEAKPATDTLQDGTLSLSNRIALTINETAKALGVTRRAVEGMIDRGEIKPKPVGRRLLIGVEQLRKFFA